MSNGAGRLLFLNWTVFMAGRTAADLAPNEDRIHYRESAGLPQAD